MVGMKGCDFKWNEDTKIAWIERIEA